jgi:hypothetical protein
MPGGHVAVEVLDGDCPSIPEPIEEEPARTSQVGIGIEELFPPKQRSSSIPKG